MILANENPSKKHNSLVKRIIAVVIAMILAVSSFAIIGRNVPLSAAPRDGAESQGLYVNHQGAGSLGAYHVLNDEIEAENLSVEPGAYRGEEITGHGYAVAMRGGHITSIPPGYLTLYYTVDADSAVFFNPSSVWEPFDDQLFTTVRGANAGPGEYRYRIYVTPRYGYSLLLWGSVNTDHVQPSIITANRQLTGNQFYVWEGDVNVNSRIAVHFVRLEISGSIPPFDTRIVGYDSIAPISPVSVTLTNTSSNPSVPIPSVPTSPDASGNFPEKPGVAVVPGTNFNAVLRSQLSNPTSSFNFGAPNNFDLQLVNIGAPNLPPNTTFPISIGVQPNLPAGNHKDVVLVRHGPEVVGRVCLSFRVIRPVRHISFLNQDRTAQELDAALRVRDHWNGSPLVTLGDLPAVTFDYEYVTPLSRHDSNIRIEVTSDEFTFFQGPASSGYVFTDITFTPPQGYNSTPVSVTYNNGVLTVEFSPIPAPTINITRQMSGELAVNVPTNYPGYVQATHTVVSSPAANTGQRTITITNPPGGYHFNASTAINYPTDRYIMVGRNILANGNQEIILHPIHTITFSFEGASMTGYTGPVIRTRRLQHDFIETGALATHPQHPVNPQFGVPTAEPMRAGYDFDGWQQVDANGVAIGSPLSPAQVAGLRVSGDLMFVAAWTPIGGVATPTPAPTATPVPSATSPPTTTPEPGAVSTPSPRPTPSPSPVPDVAPTPTPVPPTPAPMQQMQHAFIVGFPDGYVRPNEPVTRAHFSTILFRLITDSVRAEFWSMENPFTDVSANRWHNNAISTTTNLGFFNGMPDGTFQPYRFISRAEITVSMMRFLGISPYIGVNPMFNDIDGHWAQNYINHLALYGWASGFMGMDGYFLPNQPITRAEAAALIIRMLGHVPKCVDSILDGAITFYDNADPNAWYYLYILAAANSYYFVRHEDGIHVVWYSLIPPRRWYLLERPDSKPEDIFEN